MYNKVIESLSDHYEYNSPKLLDPLQLSENITILHLTHLVCSDYLELSNAIESMRSINIRQGAYYSSAINNIACLLAVLSKQDLLSLYDSPVLYKLILPLGNIRKLDNSLVTGIMWMKHQQNPHERYFLDWLRDNNPLVKLLDDPNQKVHISISYRKSWTNETQKYSIDKWIDPKYISQNHHSDYFMDTNSKLNSHVSRLQANTIKQAHVISWLDYNRDTKTDPSGCDFENLIVEHKKNQILLIDSNRSYITNSNLYHSACILSLVRGIASDPAVIKISLSVPMRLLNNNARGIIQSHNTDQEPWSVLNLDGSGQIVGVSDTGIDENSCYFIDKQNGPSIKSTIYDPKIDHNHRKIRQYITYSGSSGDVHEGHGSHVCGSIAGSCLANDANAPEYQYKYHGMAPNAKLAFFDIMGQDNSGDLFIPVHFGDLFSPAYMAGARIHSNSWGGGFVYDSFCLDVDEYLYDNPDFLVFFAAGNDGPDPVTILSPGLSKNSVAVAASENSILSIGIISSFSAQGPAFDGRIKPDITVPGSGINSALAHTSGSETCQTTQKSGTSMATPIAAGSATLIRQYFKDKTFWPAVCKLMRPYSNLDQSKFTNFKSLCTSEGIDLRGSLLKALVLHSGTSMSPNQYSGISSPPDNRQGYGLINLSLLLPLPGLISYSKTLFVEDGTLYSFTERTYSILVTDPSQPLKVTLSWYDPPNLEFAARVVLHDIDVVLIDPMGLHYYGNYKSSSSTDNTLLRDETNNNEQINIPSAKVGTWTLKIQSKLFTQSDNQVYSIVISCTGYVSSITETELNPLSYSICSASVSNQSLSMMHLDIALFDDVDTNGWSNHNYFRIMKFDPASQLETLVLQDKLTGNFYGLSSTCLSSGNYYAELVLGSSEDDDGIQMSIPQCDNLYLTPLAKKQFFYIEDSYITYKTGSGKPNKNADHPICRPDYCSSSSYDSLKLNVTLFEGGGVGWSGAYYVVHDYTSLLQDQYSGNDYSSYALTAGTLEWGYLKSSTICLQSPAETPSTRNFKYLHDIKQQSNKTEPYCFAIELSVPSKQIPELFPQLSFDDAIIINKDGSTSPCPHNLDLDTSVALFCNSYHSSLYNLTFYKSSIPKDENFGQSYETWNNFNRFISNITQVGNCLIIKKYSISFNYHSPKCLLIVYLFIQFAET